MSTNAGKDSPDFTNTLVVSKTGGGQFDSIGQAIRSAPAGARILVGPGIYREGLTISQPLEIIGDGPAKEIIVEGLNVPALRMQAARALVRGLTLRGVVKPGEEYNAVDIEQGDLILEDCDITSKGICVGIHGTTAAPTIHRCTIHHGSCGVFVYDGGQGTIEDCDISDTETSGVEIWNQANPVLRRCQIKSAGGSGVYVNQDGRGVLEDCNIFGNALSEEMINVAGAAEVTVAGGGAPTLRRCRIHDGNSSGVFVAAGGRGELTDCEIYGNRFAGIQVGAGGSPTVRGCRVNRNGGHGVWVQVDGAVDLQGCDLTGNTLGEQQIDQPAGARSVTEVTQAPTAASTAAAERVVYNVAARPAKGEPETLLGSFNGHAHGLKEFQMTLPNLASLGQVSKSVAQILQFDPETKIVSQAAPRVEWPDSSLWFKILAEYDSPMWKGMGGKPMGKIQASFTAVQEETFLLLIMQFSDLENHWTLPGSENKVVEMLFAVADRLQQGLGLESPLAWQATKGDWFRRDILITVPPRRPVYLKSPRPQPATDEQQPKRDDFSRVKEKDKERPAKPPGLISQIFKAINQSPPVIKSFIYIGMVLAGIRWFQVTNSGFDVLMFPLGVALGGLLGFGAGATIQCGINDSRSGNGAKFKRYMFWTAAIPAGLMISSVIFGGKRLDEEIGPIVFITLFFCIFVGAIRYLHLYSKQASGTDAASKN